MLTHFKAKESVKMCLKKIIMGINGCGKKRLGRILIPAKARTKLNKKI